LLGRSEHMLGGLASGIAGAGDRVHVYPVDLGDLDAVVATTDATKASPDPALASTASSPRKRGPEPQRRRSIGAPRRARRRVDGGVVRAHDAEGDRHGNPVRISGMVGDTGPRPSCIRPRRMFVAALAQPWQAAVCLPHSCALAAGSTSTNLREDPALKEWRDTGWLAPTVTTMPAFGETAPSPHVHGRGAVCRRGVVHRCGSTRRFLGRRQHQHPGARRSDRRQRASSPEPLKRSGA
jgi:hypothetical protein